MRSVHFAVVVCLLACSANAAQQRSAGVPPAGPAAPALSGVEGSSPQGYQANVGSLAGWRRDAAKPAGEDASAPASRYAGRPLVDALRDLETRGLRLIYSNDVVRPEMIVSSDPRSTEPRRILDELLREHHLKATRGPRGSIVIVRDVEKAPPPPTARTAAPKMPVALESIVVTPSHFTIFTSEPEGHQFLSREEVRTVPHIGDDVYRAFDRLPGITGIDVSARFNVRGGEEDETEVLVDGAEVYDPFHVRDLYRAFSTIDAEAVGAVDVLTGGFPVQYGGPLSGVIDISSLKPSAGRHTELGIGFLNTRLLSDGTFHDGTDWLVSLRRGYLRELLKVIDSTSGINPSYYDLIGKVEKTLNERTVVSGDVFLSGDALRVREDGGVAHGSYSDRYAWMNLRSALTPKLFTQTVASIGRIGTHRVGGYGNDQSDEAGAVNDDRAFELATLRNDSSWDISARNVVKAGFTAKSLRTRYDYNGNATIRESLLHFNDGVQTIDRIENGHNDGNDLAVYAADRAAITPQLVLEAGLRADEQSYAPDGVHVAPRINASYALGEHATLRASWGRFYQAQGLNELQVEDGVTTFYPSERADHALLGAEYDFGHGYSARAEVYDKRFTQLRPRFENIFDRVVVYPELHADRVLIDAPGGRARGGELLVRKASETWSGWISVARASAHDIINLGSVSTEVPRAWDQRDTATFNVDYRAGAKWSFDVAGVFHSGWPTTPVDGVLVNGVFHTVLGPYNSERLPAYRRVDFRASHNMETSRGGLSFFVELFNVFGIHNVISVNGYTFTLEGNGLITGQRHTASVLGIVPSFGVTYAF